MQWGVYVEEGNSGKWHYWTAKVEKMTEGFFFNLFRFIIINYYFYYYSPTYIPWCPFLGGAPSKYSKPPLEWWISCAVVDCPCSAAVPYTAQKFLGRAFDCWFEEFGLDRSMGVGNLLEVFTCYPYQTSSAGLAAEAQGSTALDSKAPRSNSSGSGQ